MSDLLDLFQKLKQLSTAPNNTKTKGNFAGGEWSPRAWFPYRTGTYKEARGTYRPGSKTYTPLKTNPGIRTPAGRYTPGASKNRPVPKGIRTPAGRYTPGASSKGSGGGLASFARAIWGIGQDYKGLVNDPAIGVGSNYMPSQQDYASMAQSFMNSLPAVEMPDAREMVDRQFDPQYDLLSTLRTQATGRYNKAGQDTEAMYKALADSILGQVNTTAKEYDTTAQNLDVAFNSATNDINATANKSMDVVNEQMKRLGITDAAPDAYANIAEEQGRAINNVAGIEASFAGSNEALKQSQMDYMRNTSHTTGIAGANAKADIMLALEGVLGGYDAKELEIKGQEGKTLNDYLMQIAGMQQEANASAQQSFLDSLEMQQDQDRWAYEQGESARRWGAEQDWERERFNAQNEVDRAKADFEVQKWAAESRNPSSTKSDWDNDASGQLAHFASQYFQGDPTRASAVAAGIQEAFAIAQPKSAAEFINFVNRRFPNNVYKAQYAALASNYAQAMGLR